ncbi:MAG: hypothetical protein H0T50_15695 [Gemmatimonadales bacterium]|nr:hypothetical protein [Gemmatimonadales bacterium]
MNAIPGNFPAPAKVPPPGKARRATPADPDEISLLSLVNVVLRHRGLVAGVAMLCFGTVVLLTLVQPRTYLSSSSLLPKSREGTSNLAGIAAQFGLNVPTTESTASPEFYEELLETRHILGRAVDTKYTFGSAGNRLSGTLVDLYEVDEETAALRKEGAIKKLREDIEVDVHETGVVNLEVKTRHAPLSQLVNRRLVQLLQQFNLETRQSQAGAERRFTERRLKEVERDLRAAEDKLQAFLQRNRDYRNSPMLGFEEDRLTREISRQQMLYTSLSQAFETAKIDEVRDTPVLTVVEPPQLPIRPEARGTIKRGVLALAVGLLVGVLLAFGKDLLVRSRHENGDEFEEFTVLRRAALDDLLHPWRPIGRLVRPRRSGSAYSSLSTTQAADPSRSG